MHVTSAAYSSMVHEGDRGSEDANNDSNDDDVTPVDADSRSYCNESDEISDKNYTKNRRMAGTENSIVGDALRIIVIVIVIY